MAFARDALGGVVLEVWVKPRAARTRASGEHDGRLKVELHAPPLDGEANLALLEFLAHALGVKRSEVTLLRGRTGRKKTVRVEGVTAAQARLAL